MTIPEQESNEQPEQEPVSQSPVDTKPPVDWWNRYVVPSAVGILVLIALYWLITTYVMPSAK
ncbi:MAG: hypothetical protein WAU88_13165 [Candidatus Zixiibacteriota bacterium]